MASETPEITAYLKTFCGWSEGVRAVFRKYGLDYTEKDIINPAFRWEMEQKSGQPLSPCVIVNGTMLADVSGEEVEHWMISNGVIEPSDAAPGRTDRFRLHRRAARGDGGGGPFRRSRRRGECPYRRVRFRPSFPRFPDRIPMSDNPLHKKGARPRSAGADQVAGDRAGASRRDRRIRCRNG